MAPRISTIVLLLGSVLAASPALAQFGTIFGNEPPRPPGNVPNRPPADAPPDRLPPGPPPGVRIQSQPLPPPPGAASAPPAARTPLDTRPQDAQAPTGPGVLPGLAPGQRQPRGTPASIPQPSEEPSEPPAPKLVNPTAVFSGLDKITGRIITFEVAINETVRFGALEVTPRACYTRPPTETANTDGFIEVDELTLQGELRRIFTGWMFAASPGLNAVEHPIYDIWLADCKGAAGAVAEAPPETPAPPPARPQRQQQQRRAVVPPAPPLPPPPFR